MMYDVYLSYCHIDRHLANDIYRELEKSGVNCFKTDDIVTGIPVTELNELVIRNTKLYVMLISKTYSENFTKENSWVKKNIELSKKLNITLLPIILDESIRYSKATYEIRKYQPLHVYDNTSPESISKIAKAIKQCLEYADQIKNDNSIIDADEEIILQDNLRFRAYDGDKPYIFISYSHKNSDIVLPIINKWHNAGYRIWYDEGINPGNEWREEIAIKLDKCAYFIIFISPKSIKSKNVRNELNFAESEDKPFLAIHITETKLPPGIKLTIGGFQAIMKYKMSERDFQYKINKTLPVVLKE